MGRSKCQLQHVATVGTWAVTGTIVVTSILSSSTSLPGASLAVAAIASWEIELRRENKSLNKVQGIAGSGGCTVS